MHAPCTLRVPSIQWGCSALGQRIFRSVILSVMALSLACGSAFGWAGGGCFLPETPILLADGTSKPISEVESGMRLLAFDERGRIVETVVRETYRREVPGYLVIETSRRSVRVTDEHPFFDGAGNFRPAGELKVGDEWFVLHEDSLEPETIIGVHRHEETIFVHNLLVDDPHTYFARGIAVHNKGGGGGSYSGGGSSYSGGSYSRGGGKGGGWLALLITFVFMLVVLALALFFRRIWTTLPPGRRAEVGGIFKSRMKLALQSSLTVRSNRANLDVVLLRRQILKKSKKTEKLLEFIGRTDEAWRTNKLTTRARKLFLTLQEQWQARDYLPIKHEMSPVIYKDHTRQLEGLKRNREINVIEDLEINAVDLVNVRYTHEPENREFTVLITATGKNYYVDERTKRINRGDRTPGKPQQFWTFEYMEEDKRFVLREIEQSSASDILADENFFEPFTEKGVEQIYGDEADQEGEAGPWLEKKAETKENKTERLLNFLAQTDKGWNRRDMLEGARSLFLVLMLDREKGTLSQDTRKLVFPDLLEHLDEQMGRVDKDKTRYEYRNLSVRKAEIVLIRNFNDDEKDEYVVRIRAHAQTRIWKDGKLALDDPDVRAWQEYWVFGSHQDQWKLKEMLIDGQGEPLWEQENFDEGTGQQMLDWYYSKDRAA